MNSGWEHEDVDQSGWDQWLAQHTPSLLLFARQRARCEADAQDLLQEAVVESWRRQRDGKPPSASLVFATIRRRAIDLARNQDRRAAREAAVATDAAPAWFDTALEDRERNRLIEEAMRALPEAYREVVTLKIWGGLTFAEIAEALEIPANTAASRYRYGLAGLREASKQIFA